MRTYLCGPSGADKAVYVAAEAALRAAQIVPAYGPHDLMPPAGATPDDVARLRMRQLAECEQVCLLDGWASCPVAEFEAHVARRLGMRCTALVILLSGG